MSAATNSALPRGKRAFDYVPIRQDLIERLDTTAETTLHRKVAEAWVARPRRIGLLGYVRYFCRVR